MALNFNNLSKKDITKIIIIPLVLLFILACSEDKVNFSGTGVVTGKVVEVENFNPINNAKVVLTPTNNTVFTDEEGNFRFQDVATGDYSVSATKEGFLTGFEPISVTDGLEGNVVFELDIETASNKPPATPELILPTDNETDVELESTLIWKSSDPEDDTLSYILKIKNDRDDEVLEIDEIIDTTYIMTGLKNNTKYFWQVGVTDSINSVVWSTIKSFTTKEFTQNRYLFVREEQGNNIIFSSDGANNEVALTSANQNSWRPRKNSKTNRIAFLRSDGLDTHIYTMNPDGSDVYKVTSSIPVNGFKQSELDFSWSTYGSKLLYPHFDRLYEINKDGSGQKLVYQTPNGTFISKCDWSHDGKFIALKTNNANGYNASIYVIDLNGNIKHSVLENVNGAAGGINLSIDNKKLLYTYDISGYENDNYRLLNSQIFIHDFATNTVESLSVDKVAGTNDLDPRFSPDEAQIIFMNTSNDGISEKNILTQDVVKGNTDLGNNYNREVLFSNALMSDWE